MGTLELAVKLGVTAFVAYEIYMGESWSRFRIGNESLHVFPQRIYRDETPGFFWFSIAVKAAIVISLWCFIK